MVQPLKVLLYIIAEFAIASLLAALLFVGLLFAPDWVWILAPAIHIAAFVCISRLAGRNTFWSWAVVVIAPISLVGYWIVFSILAGSLTAITTVALNYLASVLLLGAHCILNSRIGKSARKGGNAE